VITLTFGEKTTRRCGDCQLCCKLLPVRAVAKGAGERCRHQRHHKGCAVYPQLAAVAPECRLWSCRWLSGQGTEAMSRPDRSHYVIDVMPDFVTVRDEETGRKQHLEVVQIWVDPRYPDAHRDPALRAFLEREAERGVVALVRWDNARGMVIFPPALSADGQWHEVYSGLNVKEHDFAEVVSALSAPP
jgi:hypothetical protein